MQKLSVVLLTIILLPLLAFARHADIGRQEELPKRSEGNRAFRPGERLTYDLRWEFVPAGTATLEVLPMDQIDGVEVYHFAVTVRTNEVLDKIYKIRDRMDAYADIAMTHSILYRKNTSEGKRQRNAEVSFDWENSKVRLMDSGKKRRAVQVPAGTFDPLSVFYAFRLQNLSVKQELQAPVTDGKKCVLGKADVLARERVKVEAGDFDAFLVQPDLKDVGGVVRKSKDAKLMVWISADERHIPVKISSRVKVGSFHAQLVSIE